MTCEICSVGDGKYCCPGCGRRTCSVRCVKEHKEKFNCSGIRPVPTAPEAIGNEKYSEEMFVKDYNFLEEINVNMSKCEGEKYEDSERKKRSGIFKRIQRMAKLSELRLLPSTFTRSKKNRTHLITEAKESENISEEPEKKSTRQGRIAWTIDLTHYENGKLIETIFDFPDDEEFHRLLPQNTQRAFLRNETRLQNVPKWREIIKTDWQKKFGQILVDGRIFEYPQIGIIRENEKHE